MCIRDRVFSAGFEAEGTVEGSDAVDVNQRVAGFLGDDAQGFSGKVTIFSLYILEDSDKAAAVIMLTGQDAVDILI